MTDEVRSAIQAVLSSENETPREYDAKLNALIRACIQEHKSLTTNEDGIAYQSEFSIMCNDFIIDTYFGGRHPSADLNATGLIYRARIQLSSILRNKVGVRSKGYMYKGEVQEMRIALMDKQSICEEIEKRVGSIAGGKLKEIRLNGYSPM